ncbi:MAG: RNA-splicing ligase RtcB [Candidatus Anoxychlamydiales bacterium]|uniref:3'-phosphate/5'-hydroxy nucleic acid ligase n=1 Tax=marine sediment metagenome TaxID=412755 RepID=A0A0F9L4A3_9ZZZZ|nr:RNA-splicing ligase RtcB [Candidatus Anoxychlamydiales bacterium]NGX40814.1 RNA-splicing ligase RtcB [Candidatus Anoxychlamydiales bacterium]
MYNLKKIGPSKFLVPKEGKMRVDGLIIAKEELLEVIKEDKSIEQVKNVATLPGIVGYSIAMPDIHWGYGFPIGGVAAFDAETGIISPGGVGYDINCGVRIALLPIKFSELKEKYGSKIIKRIFELVPTGVGYGHRGEKHLSDSDYLNLAQKGAKWSIEQGYGIDSDLDHIESNGKIDGADISLVSNHAKDRGRKQLGTLGSGNHFIEIGKVENIYLPDIAKKWGLEKDLAYVIIHSGSRGFGHQVCQDVLNVFIKKGYAKDLPDRQLVAAPINSEDGKNYFSQMAVAANFAFNNRQQMLHLVRVAINDICSISFEDIKLLYDVCHNIAKFETYNINGKPKRLCVHRKGATRAFGPGSEELNPIFKQTGQPVLVPGDMGTASHILAGLGNDLTWRSSCHGAGRMKSRAQSSREWKGKDLKTYMREKGIEVFAKSYATIAEEMPDAYKDVDIVVDAVQEAGLANKVARLTPSYVIKG